MAVGAGLLVAGAFLIGRDALRRRRVKKEIAPPTATEPVEPADARQSETRTLWLASPGAGRLAAELIAQAPDLAAARQIWEGYRAAPRQTDLRWAHHAFVARLNEAGEGDEITSLTQALLLGEEIPVEELDYDEELEAHVTRWMERTE